MCVCVYVCTCMHVCVMVCVCVGGGHIIMQIIQLLSQCLLFQYT